MKSLLKEVSRSTYLTFIISSYTLIVAVAWISSLYISLSSDLLYKKGVATALLMLWMYESLKSNSKWKINFKLTDILISIVLLALSFVLLDRSIMFKGDEAFHIQIALNTLMLFKTNLILLILSIGYGIASFFIIKSRKSYLLLAVTIVFISLISTQITIDEYQKKLLFRWPITQYFFTYPLIILNSIFSFSFDPYSEWIYRIVPFASFILIAFLISDSLNSKRNKLIIIVFILTIPVVQYYSFLYYEEPLALVFYVLALLKYVKNNYRLNDTISWLFLISIVFKDSFLLYVLLFLCVHFLYELWETEDISIKMFVTRAMNGLFIIIPGIVFKLFQQTPYDSSGTSFVLPRLNDFIVIGFAIYDQFFVLLIIAVLCLILFDKKFRLFSLLASIVGFYLVNPVLNTYLGYSRYSLILVGIMFVILKGYLNLLELKPKLFRIIFTLAIAINLVFSPYKLDNFQLSMIPMWGDYKYYTSEFWYDYDSLYSDIKNTSNESIVTLGRSYFYYDSFYHFKYNISENSYSDLRETSSAELVFDSLAKINPSIIIQQIDPLNPQFVDSMFVGYSIVKRYERGEMVLNLFQKKYPEN